MNRVVCQFSCGATSAVACKLALAHYGGLGHEVVIINAFLKEEHEDNRRFAAECEAWFGQPMTVLRDEKYGASAYEVFRRERYMNGPKGAPCTRALKRRVLDAFKRPDDIVVIGYDAGEQDRLDDFRESFPDINIVCPLIDRGLSKADCLAMMDRAGIRPSIMYELGFENANCIGCVKGGEGYWNQVRRVFPIVFHRMADLQEDIGEGAYFFRNRDTGVRFGLKQLDPEAGRLGETMPSCSFFCELAEQEYSA